MRLVWAGTDICLTSSPIWSLYSKLQINQIEKVQKKAGLARDGERRVVSVKCMMSLSGHLLRSVGISPPIWSLYSKLQINQIEKVQKKAGLARDGERRVVSVKCMMSLSGHLLRSVGISPPCFSFTRFIVGQGALWLSGRVLVSGPRGPEYEPHRHHCVVSLSKTHLLLLSTGSTQETCPDITEKWLTVA